MQSSGDQTVGRSRPRGLAATVNAPSANFVLVLTTEKFPRWVERIYIYIVDRRYRRGAALSGRKALCHGKRRTDFAMSSVMAGRIWLIARM